MPVWSSNASHSIDQYLHPHQYGFRQNRSLSTPLFLLRHLTEIFWKAFHLFIHPFPWLVAGFWFYRPPSLSCRLAKIWGPTSSCPSHHGSLSQWSILRFRPFISLPSVNLPPRDSAGLPSLPLSLHHRPLCSYLRSPFPISHVFFLIILPGPTLFKIRSQMLSMRTTLSPDFSTSSSCAAGIGRPPMDKSANSCAFIQWPWLRIRLIGGTYHI